MGSCCSSETPEKKQTSESTYKRTNKTTGVGKRLDDSNAEVTDEKLDPKTAAAEAAQKRFESQNAKDGKLGQKLASERKKSTQAVINEKAKQNLQDRKQEAGNLVYD